MTYMQSPPYTIKVELSEGCNLACTFCGINGIREKPGKVFNWMTLDTAEEIAGQLAGLVRDHRWNPHIEFTMHGEPTMNPAHPEIIHAFRKALPRTQLMLTSNGGGLLAGDTTRRLNDLFLVHGLNILALDDYDGVKIVEKIRDRTMEGLKLDASIKWYEYPHNKDGHPHKRRHYKTRMITVIADLMQNAAKKAGTHSNIANHCGAAAPRNPDTMGRKCARPFRELAIRWDGNVGACCDDWRGEYKIGNVVTEPIPLLWHNARFTALRRKVYHGQRDFGACLGCTSRSYRVGLLPDPMGKQSVPLPNAQDLRAIQEATRGAPLAFVVLRPWEK